MRPELLHELDIVIAEKERIVAELTEAAQRLPKEQSELATLKAARQVIVGSGEPVPQDIAPSVSVPPAANSQNGDRPLTLAEVAAQEMRDDPELEVDEIFKRVTERGIETTRPSLVSALARDVEKGLRFKRTKPGTYALI